MFANLHNAYSPEVEDCGKESQFQVGNIRVTFAIAYRSLLVQKQAYKEKRNSLRSISSPPPPPPDSNPKHNDADDNAKFQYL